MSSISTSGVAMIGDNVALDRISIEFGNFQAASDVSVDIRPGEFFSFLGPSGCGKTTILRTISGFQEPTRGTVEIGGRPMKGISPNKRPTALIFQNLALFPLMPVWENIAFGLRVRGMGKTERRARAERLLDIVEMSGTGDKMVSQLSGGQRQRIAIARALAVEPKVMLLDEPLSALDLKLRQHMRAELRAIQERTGVTFIYITHDQGEALAMSDRIGVMSRGRLQQVDSPEAIYNRPVNAFVASFVGENTILDGRIAAEDGKFVRFDTTAGTFLALPGPELQEGAFSRLFVRPEHVRVGGEAASNSVSAAIAKIVFEGNLITVVGRTSHGTDLTAQFTNNSTSIRPKVGDHLNFSFDPADAQVLASEPVRTKEVA